MAALMVSRKTPENAGEGAFRTLNPVSAGAGFARANQPMIRPMPGRCLAASSQKLARPAPSGVPAGIFAFWKLQE
jgi:hypothetical protein